MVWLKTFFTKQSVLGHWRAMHGCGGKVCVPPVRCREESVS